jgi:hypothetical protein
MGYRPGVFPSLLILGQLAAVGVMAVTVRGALRNWRLSLRRERVLIESLALAGAALATAREAGLEIDLDRLDLALSVALLDELTAQDHLRFWQRVPLPGEPWPESVERAPIVTA